jgi:hypothetical protein
MPRVFHRRRKPTVRTAYLQVPPTHDSPVWQHVRLAPEPQILFSSQQAPWIPWPTSSFPPSETCPGAQQALMSVGWASSTGTWRSGGQHTYGDVLVRPPLVLGSSLVHLFGLGQHIRCCLPGGPTPQHVSLPFLQQRPGLFLSPGSRQQNVVVRSQHVPFPPQLVQHLPLRHSSVDLQHFVPHFRAGGQLTHLWLTQDSPGWQHWPPRGCPQQALVGVQQ